MATIRERKTNTGEKRYLVEVRLKGFKPQTATFKRKTDAKRWAQQTESAIQEGRHFKTSDSKKRTVAELIDKYIKEVMPHKEQKTKLKQAMQLMWWKDEIGHFSLAELSTSILSDKKNQLLEDKAPATVVRYLAALSPAFTVACNEWEWLESNPLSKVKRPKEPTGRIRFLDDHERKALLEACKQSKNEHLFPVVVLAISTGMRQMEILNLTWKNVDLKRQQAYLLDTKNGERRAVPITGLAHELLTKASKVRRIDTDLIFPSSVAPQSPIFIRKHWQEAVKQAEIENFRFHDLRHTAASYLAMNGASLADIAEILGHKTLQMVKRYAHLSEQHTKSVVQSMNDKIFS